MPSAATLEELRANLRIQLGNAKATGAPRTYLNLAHVGYSGYRYDGNGGIVCTRYGNDQDVQLDGVRESQLLSDLIVAVSHLTKVSALLATS